MVNLEKKYFLICGNNNVKHGLGRRGIKKDEQYYEELFNYYIKG